MKRRKLTFNSNVFRHMKIVYFLINSADPDEFTYIATVQNLFTGFLSVEG